MLIRIEMFRVTYKTFRANPRGLLLQNNYTQTIKRS